MTHLPPPVPASRATKADMQNDTPNTEHRPRTASRGPHHSPKEPRSCPRPVCALCSGLGVLSQHFRIDNVLRTLAAEVGFDAVDDQIGLMTNHVTRGAAEMWRHQHVWQGDEAIIGLQRLIPKDI